MRAGGAAVLCGWVLEGCVCVENRVCHFSKKVEKKKKPPCYFHYKKGFDFLHTFGLF